MNPKGTILVIGLPRVAKTNLPYSFAMNKQPQQQSKCFIINPFEPPLDKLSGMVFTGIIVMPGAEEGRYYNQVYNIGCSRIRI